MSLASGNSGANGPNGIDANARDPIATAVANPSRAADLAAEWNRFSRQSCRSKFRRVDRHPRRAGVGTAW